ncbi:calmodulin-binding protein 60 D-like [Setaria italica]|uniref:calmodulin-binding protein 60 D-like n=1 Tax=Setaria italica TaxID=4555 RepID=UPI000648F423|nr:calmodulin-binding protein 60 D-like [Setaria italica]XP_012703846.1 calmodulin-binding protein 60 D-like [Setaria italica]
MLRVELVPVIGDFPPDGRENWSADEFQKSVVKEREGKRPLLTGDVSLAMRDCHAAVGELRFTDNSSWVRGRKFRIGVCVMPAGSIDGARVREAITEAFVVRDRHGLLRKQYPPVLRDKVWRLENIRKKGMSRQEACSQRHPYCAGLRQVMVKPAELRQILFRNFGVELQKLTLAAKVWCLPRLQGKYCTSIYDPRRERRYFTL